MKTKFLFFVMILLFFLSVFAPAFAQDAETEGPRVIDNAGLLSAGQKAYLAQRIDFAAVTYNFDLVIVTENSIDSFEPGVWADNFFDNNGYGFGPDRDGCLLLLFETDEGWDFQFSDSGRGIKILNDTAFNKLEADVEKYLNANDFSGACDKFLLNWLNYLELEAKGRNYNFFYRWNAVLVIISWILALLTGVAVVMIWKSRMNTALAQTRADAYAVPGSLAYKVKTDRFLYSKVVKTKRQTKSSGGSALTSISKHVSSSGKKHSGRGRKY